LLINELLLHKDVNKNRGLNMTLIKFYDQMFPLQDNETVLDGLLRNGVDIPHGCRAGACQACVLQVNEGEVPAKAQTGLKTTRKELGYFLSCQCAPTAPIEVRFAEQGLARATAEIIAAEKISPHILRLRLSKVLDFHAGQYLNIWHETAEKNLIRSYSIASLPHENFIELHIKIIANGKFSQWAAEHLREGDNLAVQGPLGDCFYSAGDIHQPLLCIGIGTGLAPLYGVIRDALHQGHLGKIHLILGARESTGFYLRNELADLQHTYPQVDIHFVCQSQDAHPGDIGETDIYQFVKAKFSSTKGMRAYLCGADTFVHKMKKQIFLSGANMADIHADAFLPCS
jgi:2-polyprenylphenol hydroxylase and related flavodoxin oxidoreductases